MKVNFNKDFKNYAGDLLLIDGHAQSVKEIVAQCLFTGADLKPSGNVHTDSTNKMRAYRLCQAIMSSDGDTEISAEDAVLIKEAVSGLTPGCYAQIVELIEG